LVRIHVIPDAHGSAVALETFQGVAAEGSISAAARSLDYTQSAVSPNVSLSLSEGISRRQLARLESDDDDLAVVSAFRGTDSSPG
jgi:hypothetical protein